MRFVLRLEEVDSLGFRCAGKRRKIPQVVLLDDDPTSEPPVYGLPADADDMADNGEYAVSIGDID